MPKVLNAQQTTDAYSNANTVQNVYRSKGGWIVLAAQVFAQQQLSSEAEQGSETFGEEFLLPSGAHYLEPGTIGLRVRSATTGVPVLYTICLFYEYDNAMVLGGTGISSPNPGVAALNFQHNDVAVATEPTADFEDQTGSATMNLTWTVVDDPANTRVKITPVPVWANPTVFPHDISTGPATGNFGQTGVYIGTNGTIWAASTPLGASLFVGSFTGDTERRINILNSGNITWGSGSAPVDCLFSRMAAGVLGSTTTSLTTGPVNGSLTGTQTVGVFVNASSGNVGVFNTAATTIAFYTSAVADTTGYRWQNTSAGVMSWGPGNATVDVTIQRVVNLPTGTGSFLEMTSGAGWGYGSGTGGTATCTSGGAAQTVNKPSGKITAAAAVATGGSGSYNVANTCVGIDDGILVTLIAGGGNQQRYFAKISGAGAFTIDYENNSGVNQTPVFTFQVIKGAVA